MTPLRIEVDRLKGDTLELERLTQVGPTIVTRDGVPLYVVQEATSEWLEAWAAERDETGDLTLEDYARLHNLSLDAEAYRREFPDDAPFTVPPVTP